MEYVSPEGLRLDGRRPMEMRKIRAEIGAVAKADGSAVFEMGNTKVIAAVYGPREVQNRSQQITDQALVRCEYSMANFSTGDRMRRPKGDRLIGYEGLEVINPEGGTEDAEEEAQRGRWKQEDRDSYWKMMQKYIGSDVTSMVMLPVLIFEPMTMIQKVAEMLEYSHLLDLADECEDPYMWMVYATSWAISVYYAYQRTWKPFNPILGESYEMVNHGGITFLAEQVSHHPPMSAGHAENDHFTYDVTSKLKTKFLGNTVDVIRSF